MPAKLKSQWIVPFVAVVALLVLPAAAQATLVYTRNLMHPAVYAAADNGSGAHKVGSGRSPRVSPDGQTIVYLREKDSGKSHSSELMMAPAAGGASRALMADWQDSFYLAFSPDSTTIAALRGPEVGKRTLVLIDLATGSQRTVASGYFSGFSFSPESPLPPSGHGRRIPPQLVYARSGSEKYPPHSDIFTASLTGGKPVQITHDHNSQDPLWGPAGKIVFVKLLGAKQRRYGPKNELYLMSPSGSQVKRLTHTKVGSLLQGLFPTEWSANGKRLLTEFEGQDTSYAVTVNPQTGAQKPLEKNGNGEQGFVGTALSADGKTVLGFTGGFEPGPNHNAASVPYAGGKPKVLVQNAFEPDWSR
jgi:Tol biopolymer transport system component